MRDKRMQTNMESAYKRHQSKLQSFANTVQNKMQNNGYLSEASYKQDEQTMANSAERGSEKHGHPPEQPRAGKHAGTEDRERFHRGFS